MPNPKIRKENYRRNLAQNNIEVLEVKVEPLPVVETVVENTTEFVEEVKVNKKKKTV